MSARDLAATAAIVRDALTRLAAHGSEEEAHEALVALSALERQAAESEAWRVHHQERAVRAEEALRHAWFVIRAADRVAEAARKRIALGHLDARSEVGDALLDYDNLADHRALAAAGADTEPDA